MGQGPNAVRIYAEGAGGIVAPQPAADGYPAIVQGHGSQFAAAFGKRAFSGANQTGATTSVGLATVYTGLALSNPAGSGVNLVLLRAQGVLNVAPAAFTALGLIVGFAAGGVTVHTTALAPRNSFLNGPAPVAKLDAACTLVGTPAWARWLAETTSATGPAAFDEDVQGGVIIPPGGYVAIGSTVAGPLLGLLASFQWEEIPV